MSPAPDDIARAMGLHESARRAVGLLREAGDALEGASCRSDSKGDADHFEGWARECRKGARALEAAIQPAAGDEERALAFLVKIGRQIADNQERIWNVIAGQVSLTTLARIVAAVERDAQTVPEKGWAKPELLAAFALIRAEAAATERARLTQPEAERVERLARDATFAIDLDREDFASADEFWVAVRKSRREYQQEFVRAVLTGLATEGT